MTFAAMSVSSNQEDGDGIPQNTDNNNDTALMECHSTNGQSIDMLGALQSEVVLLSWLIVLLQAREDEQVSFHWQFNGGLAANDQAQTERIREDFNYDVIANNTISDELIAFAAREPFKANAKQLRHNDRLVISTVVDQKDSCELQITVQLLADGLDVHIDQKPDTLSSFLAARHVDALTHTIGLCKSNPSLKLSECMTPTKLDLDSLWSWNSPLPPTYTECIHEIISKQTSLYAQCTAIDSWDGSFTYRQLEEYSSHFAAELQDLGVTLGDVLPLCFEKSRWTIVAALAAMKLGATFVLMDPSLPAARLQNMAEQVGATTVVSSLSQSELSTGLIPEGKTLTIGPEPPTHLKQLDISPVVPPNTIMYIIFTSGSTGTPKGVQISHQTYTSSAIPRAEAVGYSPTSRVLDFASYAFDVSIDSMFLTTLSGGCLCIPSDHDRMNDINQVIRSMKINYAGLTPSVARILEPEVIASLEGLGLGGEAVAASDVAVWGRSARVIIGYGPCECTIGCTINGNAATGRDYLSIGKGNGAAIWIADPADHEKLLPLGAVGELLVEGPIVGQGYLNDPDKTETVFVQDPAWLVAGHGTHAGRRGRLYKTGDLGKYDPDGSGGIVFVGRKDTQVKLRGQRVELGEIETQLRNQFSESFEVVVEVIKPQQSGSQPTLVAFVSPKSNAGFGTSAMKTLDIWPELSIAVSQAQGEIKKVLPIYMLPAAYIPVDAIPKLISSKIDRKQIRQLGTTLDLRQFDMDPQHSSSALSDIEQRMALAWKQVLPLTDRPLHEESNFFLLGGDSVKAMKLIPVCKAQGLALNVSEVFANPILKDMTATAKPTDNSEIQDQIPAFGLLTSDTDNTQHLAATACGVSDETVIDIYPCTPTQESLFTFSLKSDIPYTAQRIAKIPAHISTDRWKTAWENVVKTHAILRTRVVQLDQPRFAQVILDQPIEWRHESELQEYLTKDSQEGMATGQALARYGIVESKSSKDRTMVWTVHHVLYDGWSEPLILETLNAFLSNKSNGTSMPIQHLVKFISQVGSDAMHSFWLKELTGAVSVQFPPLPYRDFVPTQDTIVEYDIQLPAKDGFSFTSANLIRGAWAFVASHHLRTNDIVFGETLSGRDIGLPGVESIIGPLIATVPFRVRVDHSDTVEAYLHSIQRSVAARAPYQHMGMQHIRKVSDDAQYACETGTGMVIQPAVGHDLADLGFASIDVVRESLHFNPYPLMLACGLHSNGFRVCAGFDSRLINPRLMDRMLRQLETACNNMIRSPTACLSDISILPDDELDQIWRLNQQGPLALDLTLGRFRAADDAQKGNPYPRTAISWVCSPYNSSILLPIGCNGELWLESNFLPGNAVQSPGWLKSGSTSIPGREGAVASTGDIVSMTEDGTLSFVDRSLDFISAQAQLIDTADLEASVLSILPAGTPFAISTMHHIAESTSTIKKSSQAILVEARDDSDDSVQVVPEDQTISTDTNDDFVLSSKISKDLCLALHRLDRHCHNTLPSALTPSVYLIGHFTTNHSPRNSHELLAEIIPRISADVLEEYKTGLHAAIAVLSTSTSLTSEQKLLREYWADLLQLQLDSIGFDDGFFRLGGDSVLAMKLASKLRSAGWDLSVADIFRTIRFGQMAKAMKLRSPEQVKTMDYIPFSTLDQATLTTFLSTVIELQKIQHGSIEDVYSVTSAQKIDILATLDPHRSSYQYTLLYFDDNIVKTRLVNAWRKLVKSHAILRTVFVKYDSTFFQVVLHDLELPITDFSGDQDIEQLVKNYCALDIDTEFKVGQSFVRAAFIQSSAQRSCFVLGLSHAQYDGISLPRLLSDLGTFSQDRSPPPVPCFAQYIAATQQEQYTGPAINYWRKLLNGSSITTLHHSLILTSGRGLFKSRPVEVLQPLNNITFATLLSSAWALVLARTTGTIDVCFGNITSGRLVDLPQVEEVVGPCYQFTPVRVAFVQEWTAKELLDTMQQQITESAAYDFLGVDAISKNCTQWNSQAPHFDSLVHHQEENDENQMMPFGDLMCRVGAQKPHGDAATPFKAVSYTQNSRLHVGVVGYENDVPLIDRMLNALVDAVGELTSSTLQQTLLPSELFQQAKRLDSPLAAD